MRFLTVFGALLWINTASAQTGLTDTSWLAEDIRGAGVIDAAQSTISFHTGNALSGSGGCNRYKGAVTVDGQQMQIGQIEGSKKICAPALMDQEAKFFDALNATRSFIVEGGVLRLRDEAGMELARLSRKE